MGISRQSRRYARDVDEPIPATPRSPDLPLVTWTSASRTACRARRCCAAAGLDERLRGDPDARVSTFTYMVLWRELLTGLPDVAVPVELVRALDLAALGVTGADRAARR